MIYDENRVQVKDLKIIQNGQLISFRVKVNITWINFVSIYGPPEADNSDFFLTTKSTLDNMEGDFGLICGDFNTTMNPDLDQYGYTTDPHKKCRATIQQWVDNGELCDVVRFFHPSSSLYSWRTTIDVDEADRGPGVFRANPNLLNCTNFKILLDNAIIFTLMDAINDKSTEF